MLQDLRIALSTFPSHPSNVTLLRLFFFLDINQNTDIEEIDILVASVVSPTKIHRFKDRISGDHGLRVGYSIRCMLLSASVIF